MQHIFFGVSSRAFFELPTQVEIVPAYDAVFNQAIAGLGDFLFLLLGLGELARALLQLIIIITKTQNMKK